MRRRIYVALVAVMLLTGIAVNRIGGTEPALTSSEPAPIDASGDLPALGPVQLIDSVYAGNISALACNIVSGNRRLVFQDVDFTHTSTGTIVVTNLIGAPWVLASSSVTSTFPIFWTAFFDAPSATACPPPGTTIGTFEIDLDDGGTFFATLVAP